MKRRVSIPIAALLSAFAPWMPAANAENYQYVRTTSGAVRCVLSSELVACERGSIEGFLQAPVKEYGHWNLAEVDRQGNFKWNDGNIGASLGSVLSYGQTYVYNGWTINPSQNGTRFTNNATGHGMFVSIENTYPF